MSGTKRTTFAGVMNVRTRAGFTLVEVLIGVLVLSLALLGLGALFPVVLREQRMARETVVGVSVQRSAAAYFENSGGLNPPGQPNGAPPISGWVKLRPALTTRWECTLDPFRPYLYPYPASGNMAIGPLGGSTPLPLTDRLFPGGVNSTPTMVWDMAVCRSVPSGAISNGMQQQLSPQMTAMRVAVFTRRIDPKIRVRPGFTLYQDLEAGVVQAVAVDNSGTPTLNGIGNYAVPLYAGVFVAPTPVLNGMYPVLVLDAANSTAAAIRGASQVGQLLVDNLGIVRTVTSVDGYRLTVTPPMDKNAKRVSDNYSAGTGEGLQVTFTPGVASTAAVLTIRR
ncbi:MAG: prepilin-type N-terminal cleavage/methylation domain-containing protein [Planctomycetota bacterium]